MERPLHSRPRHLNAFLALARALLYAEQTIEAHAELFASALVPPPYIRRVRALAGCSLVLTSPQPQPRLKVLVRKLRAEPLLTEALKHHALRELTHTPARMRPLGETGNMAAITTVGQLAQWLRLDVDRLLWFADLQDRNGRDKTPPLAHYTVRVQAKPFGAARVLEAPKSHLKRMQRQILAEILDTIPLHPAVHGFRKAHSIVTFATPHAGREAALRLDLQDFFPSISGPRVQGLFRTLGYPEPVSDLLGGLCTTTTPRGVWRNTGCELDLAEVQRARNFYARPHLPQGAPTSPAIANLCAFRLDRRLCALADSVGAAYSRYADDLAFSGDRVFARVTGRFAAQVAAIVAEEGFSVHHRKTRLMRASVRQHLAGLTVNARPNLPRREWDVLEAILTNCLRHGPETQNREEHPDFRSHLAGRVAFAAMVQPARGTYLLALFRQIIWPTSHQEIA